MIQRKTKPQISAEKDHRQVTEKRGGIVPRRSVEPVDHWNFLDEIEAPMWADLNVEATCGYKDDDDDWFHISHLVHQCSSQVLISALSQAGDEKEDVELGIKGQSSPKLPPSVSRSRGKDYKSKEWGQSKCVITTNKQHPIKDLNSKFWRANLGSGEILKPKLGNGNRKGTYRPKANSLCESSSTETSRPNNLNPSASIGESKTNSNSSTITFESSEKQLKVFEVSNSGFGQTTGLLSAFKVTLRKSCVTRQAIRGESIGSRQFRGRKSSSGKSSVGSSSHPECDDRIAIDSTLKSRDATPDSRNVNKLLPANLGRVKLSDTSKNCSAESLVARCGHTTATTKSAYQENTKSKVVNPKAMRLHRGNEFLTAVTNANCKPEARRCNGLRDGKENANIRTTAGAGGVFQGQKAGNRNTLLKGDKAGLNGPKGKISSRVEGQTGVSRKVYFR